MATKWGIDFAETEDIKRSILNSPILNCIFSRMNLGIIILTILSPILFLFGWVRIAFHMASCSAFSNKFKVFLW